MNLNSTFNLIFMVLMISCLFTGCRDEFPQSISVSENVESDPLLTNTPNHPKPSPKPSPNQSPSVKVTAPTTPPASNTLRISFNSSSTEKLHQERIDHLLSYL